MSAEIKRRRGTTASHTVFTGAVGEITIDTDKKVVVVHDGVTPGGFPQEAPTNKDTSGGYAGLTLFKINLRNAANTITSWFTNSATAARTYTFPDKSMTVGDATGDTTIVKVGALNEGSITSGFGSIDVGADAINGGPGSFNTLSVATSSSLAQATATSINKVTVTPPANSATLALADGVTLTVPSSASVSGTNTGDNATNTQYSGLSAAKEDLVNKVTTFAATSHTLYPSVQAVKEYVDGLLVGLWDDRGAYDASVNTYPAAGGSGTAGAVVKGDIWTVSVAGTLGGVAVAIGDSVRALADSPGQTASNWATLENNVGYVPENAGNKDTSGGYAGLTLFKLNLRNATNTVTSWFTTAATAARTWTLPDYDGTLATLDGTETLTNKSLTAPVLGTPASGDATNLTNTIAPQAHAATAKATPDDDDELALLDSAATWTLKKLTWANLKAVLKTYFDTLYLGAASTAANAAELLGATWAEPGAIGATTPSTGAFTTLSTGGYTVATLPTGVVGDRAYVTDATAPVYNAALTGGGAVVVPVFYNGAAWVSA